MLGVEKYELLAKQAGNEDPFFLKSFWELLLPVLGVEKYELLAKQAGNEDPFFLKSFTRGLVSFSSFLYFNWVPGLALFISYELASCILKFCQYLG